MARILLLRLEGPLLAFGGETVDARGVVADFPAASMLTGLLANALGWRRGERAKLQRLQDRLVFAARIDREGERLTDFQTVLLDQADQGWTTRGRPEGRAGGAGTYKAPHIRRRDFDADKSVTVALCLADESELPDLDVLAAALGEPARPLFLGRKSCPPAEPILLASVDAPSLLDALTGEPLAQESDRRDIRVLLPASEAPQERDRREPITDRRDWRSGVHAGSRTVILRSLDRGAFPGGAS